MRGTGSFGVPRSDVRTQARTKRRALESLRQAVELWFESSIERGVLAEALDEVGFLKIPPGDALPQGENVVTVVSKRASLKIDKPANLSFALGKGNGADYIEGMIPALHRRRTTRKLGACVRLSGLSCVIFAPRRGCKFDRQRGDHYIMTKTRPAPAGCFPKEAQSERGRCAGCYQNHRAQQERSSGAFGRS